MTAAEEHPLAAGACVGLPIAVADKYFMADPTTNRFQFLTAKAICGRCAVQAFCLTEAIQEPPVEVGIRGGESPDGIAELRYRYRRSEASAAVLAAEAIMRQAPLGGILKAHRLRSGRFSDSTVLNVLPQRRIPR